MKLRIKSDGTPRGTKVVAVADDGSEVEIRGVTGVGWFVDKDDRTAKVTIEVDAVELDAYGEHGIPATA